MTGRCPRCSGRMPVRTLSPKVSRVDGKTLICGPCARVEKMMVEFKVPLTPVRDWPVGVDLPDEALDREPSYEFGGPA